MNSPFLSGLALLATMAVALAEAPATNTPPGPVQEPETSQGAQTTSAPPQANAKSAPGAQAPNGTNGNNQNGVPVTKAPNTPPKKPARNPAAAPAPSKTTATASAPAPAQAQGSAPGPAPKTPPSILDSYLADLNETLKLSADEKQDIQTYYLADGTKLQTILNDDSLPPLQQSLQVDDLRDKRNAKIEALLEDVDRQRDFLKIESEYRVALLESAAEGKVGPTQALPAVPSPSDASPAAAEAPGTPKPKDNETSIGGDAKSGK